MPSSVGAEDEGKERLAAASGAEEASSLSSSSSSKEKEKKLEEESCWPSPLTPPFLLCPVCSEYLLSYLLSESPSALRITSRALSEALLVSVARK